MRFDFFTIWGNGLQHTPEILSLIRGERGFEIVRIVMFDINIPMSNFIEGVYKCDTVPIEHLKSKTRYLLNSPPAVFFVLVKNLDPDEKYYGEGRFKHIQCSKVNSLKKKIRNAFNPRFEDLSRTITPLDPGVSHNHCVHASDYESQVDYMLKYFGLEPKEFYNRHSLTPNPKLPWHVEPRIKPMELSTRDLNDLKIGIIGSSSVPIKDSPHYKFVKGDGDEYWMYVLNNIGLGMQEDHFPESFEKLIKEFDPDYAEANQDFIVVKGNQIVDGAHRACVMLSLGIEKVKCYEY